VLLNLAQPWIYESDARFQANSTAGLLDHADHQSLSFGSWPPIQTEVQSVESEVDRDAI
jgi:hypothetical protein